MWQSIVICAVVIWFTIVVYCLFCPISRVYTFYIICSSRSFVMSLWFRWAFCPLCLLVQCCFLLCACIGCTHLLVISSHTCTLAYRVRWGVYFLFVTQSLHELLNAIDEKNSLALTSWCGLHDSDGLWLTLKLFNKHVNVVWNVVCYGYTLCKRENAVLVLWDIKDITITIIIITCSSIISIIAIIRIINITIM